MKSIQQPINISTYRSEKVGATGIFCLPLTALRPWQSLRTRYTYHYFLSRLLFSDASMILIIIIIAKKGPDYLLIIPHPLPRSITHSEKGKEVKGLLPRMGGSFIGVEF